jgi:hypothetical protein
LNNLISFPSCLGGTHCQQQKQCTSPRAKFATFIYTVLVKY